MAYASRAVEALDISASCREDRGSLISPGPSSLRAERRATSTVAGTCVSVSSSTIGMVKSIRYPLWVKPDASTSFSPSSVNICDAFHGAIEATPWTKPVAACTGDPRTCFFLAPLCDLAPICDQGLPVPLKKLARIFCSYLVTRRKELSLPCSFYFRFISC